MCGNGTPLVCANVIACWPLTCDPHACTILHQYESQAEILEQLVTDNQKAGLSVALHVLHPPYRMRCLFGPGLLASKLLFGRPLCAQAHANATLATGASAASSYARFHFSLMHLKSAQVNAHGPLPALKVIRCAVQGIH